MPTKKPTKENLKTCDVCGQEWEEDFFCKKCSNVVCLETEEVPNIFWDGNPNSDEYILEDVDNYIGDICFNCCSCQFIGIR